MPVEFPRPHGCSLRIALLTLTGLSFAASVFAQDHRQPGHGGNAADIAPQVALDLLATDMVQTEIGVTAEQRNRLALVHGALREQLCGRFVTEPDQRQQQEYFARVDSATQSASQQLASILAPNQLVRLKQIAYQQGRSTLFRCPEVLDALGATQEQTSRINAILRHENQSIEGLYAATGTNIPQVVTDDFLAKHLEVLDIEDAINKVVFEQITTVLTDQQRARLQAMFGKPIDVHRLRHERLVAFFCKKENGMAQNGAARP
jgi:hypothetical protein